MIFQSAYSLIEAGDGREALRQLHQHRPSIAILDVTMPEMSGLDVCRAIRQDPELSSTVVIIITANGTPSDRDAAYAAGADYFVAKPFSPIVMHQLIETVIETRAIAAG